MFRKLCGDVAGAAGPCGECSAGGHREGMRGICTGGGTLSGKNSVPTLKKTGEKILSRNLGQNFSRRIFARQKYPPPPVSDSSEESRGEILRKKKILLRVLSRILRDFS